VSRLFSSDVKLGGLAAVAIVLLSLAPQIHFWFDRGRDWHGAYATIQGDEFLYSAYINALIDERPRRNDPFAGRDSTPSSPLPESTFSIQFIPAFVIAWVARICRVSASTAFIVMMGVAGLLASLSIFWLLKCITGDNGLAAVGVMFVVCFGALAGAQGIVGLLLRPGVVFLGLPFLRRYQPAAVFPLFIVFCGFVWRALNAKHSQRARLYSIAAGLSLAVLIFSYLYLWTAAATWLTCLVLLWLYLQPNEERRRGLALFAMTGAIALVAGIPYALLVLRRASNLDEAQTLILTHRPDPFRAPEIIAIALLVLLVTVVRRGKVLRSDPRLIFAASFALLPLVLFNQQILTGRSMQPYHFESFVANYAVLVGLVIVVALFYQSIKRRTLLSIVAICVLWGAVEITMPVLANYSSNLTADQMVPMMLRLKELSKQDGTLSSLRDQGRATTLVFSPQRDVMALLPTWTSQGTLLGMGGLDFGSASQQERKELLYIWLYYSAADARHLRELLNGKSDDTFTNHYARIAIFGHERVVPMLSSNFRPVQPEEIEAEVRAYQSYADSFSREKVLLHPLTYAVTRGESDLSHVDLWYERDAGERIGDYNLYHLKPRY
jgi:hypothetical protein